MPAPSHPVVDIHAHIYPDKIADRAVQSVGQFYNLRMTEVDGTYARLADLDAHGPVTHSVVYSVATKAKNVTSINDFIAGTVASADNLVGFMAMHQDYPDPAAEIERACEMGLCGIKLHPDTQQVNMDDPRLMRVYEIAEARGLPLVIHCGDYRYDWSHPRRLKRILHEFPRLVVDAAHFGGWSIQDWALEFLEDERCFLDVSSSMMFLGPRRSRELIETYGPDRILFGSDFPMWNPTEEYERLAALGFSAADMEKMTWRNAERFLGRDIG